MLLGCSSVGPPKEYGYVSARQGFLRDRVAMVYNKVATVHNGDRVQILERKRRFLRVRTDAGEEGWIEQRFVAGQDVFDALQQLARANANLPRQSIATTRASLNMHVEPSRVSPAIYRLKEGDKVEILERAVTEKGAAAPPPRNADEDASKDVQQNEAEEEAVEAAKAKKEEPEPSVPAAGKVTPAVAAKPAAPPPPLEDWWLVRDSSGRYGWVLGRMIDIDIPLEVAQYAEGQRIVGSFILDRVKDEHSGSDVPEYLVLLSEPRDGLPYDYNQVRIFTWNRRRSRYETAYRERLQGYLPVILGSATFGNEGTLPTFTIRGKNLEGQIVSRTYKLNTPIVRAVAAPGQQPVHFLSPQGEGSRKSRVASRKTRR